MADGPLSVNPVEYRALLEHMERYRVERDRYREALEHIAGGACCCGGETDDSVCDACVATNALKDFHSPTDTKENT